MHRLLRIVALAAACSSCAAATPPESAGGSPAPASSPIASSAPAESFQDQILAIHNRYRAAAGVAPLGWDTALAAGAAAYAPQLAATGDLVHSAKASRPGIGENLWMGSAGRYSPGAAAESWAEERTQFRAGVFPAVSTTGDWMDVAHYSQMIWPATTRIGCAQSHGKGYDFVVCRYAPSGNRDGQRVP